MPRARKSRHHWTTKPDYIAECQGCSWTLQSRNALGVGARHHDSTGHEVRVEVSYAVYYGRSQAERRQAMVGDLFGKPGQA